MAAKPVKIFVDFMSQPSRAVMWFCRLAEIPHEEVLKKISNLEHHELEPLNPMKQVPVLQEADGWALFESHAILRYLADKHGKSDWYPTDLRHRARCNLVLDWHHTNLRQGAAPTAFLNVLAPRLGLKGDPARAKAAEQVLSKSLSFMNDHLLSSSPFLTGEAPTIADIALVCEIEQLRVYPSYDVTKFTNVSAWVGRMEALPHFNDVHKILFKVSKMLNPDVTSKL